MFSKYRATGNVLHTYPGVYRKRLSH